MNYNILATGSKGNAVFLDGGVLIDCGVAFKRLASVLYDIRLVLLTHIHADHFNKSAIRRLAKERPTVRFACRDWLVRPLLDCDVPPRSIDVLSANEGLSYNDFVSIEAVSLVHDVPNCGWKIFFCSGERLFYATDTGTLDGVEAKGFDLYMVEANHTIDDIERRAAEKMARGEFAYEVRAAENHLNEGQAIEWILANAKDNSRYILLHQHQNNLGEVE